MTGKQRATLRGMAHHLQPIIYIGKEGITETLLADADAALTAKELVKGSVGKNCALEAKEAAGLLAEALGAEPIGATGRKFILFRRNEEEPIIVF
ncbi:MAG: YhbY family RNA-binding protein [Christensenellaceae bacterium]|jgi:RNA-binding protein